MRATLIVPDNMVSIDGQLARHVDLSALVAAGVHAVQWYDSYGEVEFVSGFDPELKIPTRKPNEYITDFTPFESFIHAYRIVHTQQSAKERAIQAKIVADQEAARKAGERAARLFAIWDAERIRLGRTPPPDFNPADHLPASAEK